MKTIPVGYYDFKLLFRRKAQIALEATDMGRPLYEKYGFVKMKDEMELV